MVFQAPDISISHDDLCVSHAVNELLYTENKEQYIDLLSGFGAVFLGHSNPKINSKIQEQLNKIVVSGRLSMRIIEQAKSMIEGFFPSTHRLAGFYSTGMEAAEFAIRATSRITGKCGFAGFANSMHGKSLATSQLCWPNELFMLPEFYRLPFLPKYSENIILEKLEKTLSKQSISAVFVEPIQASSGGYQATPAFYGEVLRLCHKYKSLSVFDEILTGFYRTGPLFYFQNLDETPDIFLVGKNIGNGFPVSAVAFNKKYKIDGSMLPGSTYSGNPLACSAVVATLCEMRKYDLTRMVEDIEKTVVAELGELSKIGFTLRGKGALWMLELPETIDSARIVNHIRENNVLVSSPGRFLRLLPAATISSNNLTHACRVIYEACKKVYDA